MKSKIITSVILFLFLTSSSSFAQGLTFGIKGGANMGKIDGHSFKDEYALSYHVGGFVTIGGGKWALQPEVLFSQVNADTSTRFSDIYAFNQISHIQLKALTIPIMLNYNLSNIITLQAGPQFGILIDRNNNLLENGKNAFKSGDFSVAAGIQLKLMKFRVYGRFVGGVTDLKDIDAKDTWKVQAIQLGIGIAL